MCRILAASAALSITLTLVHAQTTTRVRIDAGEIDGVATGTVVAFKGIPFAAPPVGALRWKAPQPVAPWSGVRAAKEYGHDCMQEPFGGDAAPLGTPPDEDCLVLNVWTPAARAARPRPVMFWIYGGGFVNGGSSPEVYDGSRFAESGVVLVSANYRLGRFGFFAHPALTREASGSPLGNYAYLDQIEALRWVKRNIAAFGGDPNNVTIFGESAGGASVNMLMTSPLARELFHRAIVQSGGGRSSTLIPARTLASAEQIGVAFAAEAGITGADAKALEALRALPATRLVNGMNLMKPQPKTNSGPMIDGHIVVEDTEAAFRAGRQAKVPYIIGANDLEFGFFPTPATQVDQMLARFGESKDKAVAAYDPQGSGNKGMIGMSLASDIAMVEPARMLARLHAASGQPTWQYRFSYVASSLRGKAAGALHATEIPFVFSTVRAKYKDATTPDDEAAGRAATAYWVAFAASGDPNTRGLPAWPRYAADSDQILDFTPGGPVAEADPWKVRLDLVEQLAAAGSR
jgi:para-nitrobenzyl esterase